MRLAVYFSLFMASAALFADSVESSSHMGENMQKADDGMHSSSSYQDQSGSHMQQSQKGDYPEKMQSEKSDWDIQANVNFIYYYPLEGGLDLGYSYSGGNVALDPNSPLFGGQNVPINFSWDPGFTVALTLGMANPEPWEIGVEYFWLKQSASGSATKPSGGQLFPNWMTISITSRDAETLAGQWDLLMQLFDVELAKLFQPAVGSHLRPFFGLRSSWIDQKYNLLAEGLINQNLSNNGTFVKSDSWGIGIRTGVDGNHDLTHGFALYTNISGSLLYAQYKIQEQNTAAADPTVDAYDYAAKYYSSYLNMELSTGFSWNTSFYNDAANFMLSAGYDFRAFFNQNWLSATQDAARDGLSKSIDNLILQGLNIGAQLTY